MIHKNHSLLVLGEPGIGKTTFIHEIAFRESINTLEKIDKASMHTMHEIMIPWVINLSKYSGNEWRERLNNLREEKNILQFLYESGLDLIFKGDDRNILTNSDFANLIEKKCIWFLCDAFDQSEREISVRILKLIYDLNCKMIVTSRRIGAPDKLPRMQIVEIDRLTIHEQKNLLKSHIVLLSNSECENILEKVDQIGTIGSIPFYLLLIAELYNQSGKVPLSLGNLLRSCVTSRIANQLYKNKKNVSVYDRKVVDIMNCLGRFAFDLHQANLTFLDVVDFFKFNYMKDEYVDLSLRTEILAKSADGLSFSFMHRRWQEWFSGYHIWQTVRNKKSSEFAYESIYQSMKKWIKFHAYDDTFFFCAGLMDDPKEFIKWIAQIDPILASRTIYETHVILSKEIFDDLWFSIEPIHLMAVRGLCYLALSKNAEEHKRDDELIEDLMRSPYGGFIPQILCEIGSKKAFTVLSEILVEEEYDFVYFTIEDLLKIESKSGNETLLKLSKYGSTDAKFAVATFLGEIKSIQTISSLIELLGDKNPDLRTLIAMELSKIGLEFTLNFLIRKIQSNDSKIKEFASEAVSALCPAIIFEDLLTLLIKEHLYTRDVTLESVPENSLGLLVDHWIDLLMDEKNYIYLCDDGILRDTTLLSILKSLDNSLKNRNFVKRLVSAKLLGRIESSSVIDLIIRVLQDIELKEYIIRKIGLSDIELVTNDLLKALKDNKAVIRRFAAETLGFTNSEIAVNELLNALDDEDPSVRRYAAESLGLIGSNKAINSLIETFKDKNFWVRYHTARALGSIGSIEAVEALIQALEDENSSVRSAALESLGLIGSESAVEALIKSLQDSEYSVRRDALKALISISDRRTFNFLKDEWKKSKHWEIADALEEISKKRPSFEKYWLTNCRILYHDRDSKTNNYLV